jgi:ornithine cyclodeaminase/alanine dehydrogenase-like protein (mu-crystallin family)
MVLMLTDEDCAKIVDIGKSITLTRDAFSRLGMSKVENPSLPRTRLALKSCKNRNFLFTVIGGITPGSNLIALRYESGLFDMRVRNRVDFDERSSLVFLYDRTDGKIVSIIQSDYISQIRVAATTAVATDVLANISESESGIIGSGRMASLHLRALRVTRRTEKFLAFSRNPIRLRRFCHEMEYRFEIPVEPCESSKDLVQRSELITVATNSREPTFNGKYLRSGSHVNSTLSPDQVFSGQDVDNLSYERADFIVVNSIKQAHLDKQIHLLNILRQKGKSKICELSDVVAQNIVARKKEDDITIYDNNSGIGIQFSAICEHVYNEAKRKGIGHVWQDKSFELNMAS